MLLQNKMINKVKDLCANESSIVAAVMYGSFTRGEGDEFSDIEFYFFINDDLHKSFSLPDWISKISPIDECFQNEFGTTVALFDNLVRGEFHALPIASLEIVKNWVGIVWVQDIDSMIIKDQTGELRSHLSILLETKIDHSNSMEVFSISHRFLDWIVFGTNVLRRGEHARALELLWFVHRHLLWMIRIQKDKTENFPTPSKSLEKDIAPETYERYKECTSTLIPESLENAYFNSWSWGKELITELSSKLSFDHPDMTIHKIDKRFIDWFNKSVV